MKEMAQQSRSLWKRFRIHLVVLIMLAVIFTLPGSRKALLGFFNLGQVTTEEGVYYTCPMHPDIRLPQLGDCPICGMTLVKKIAGEEEQSGRVSVTTRQMQLTGVTVEPLRVRGLAKELDTYGKIDYDETRLGIVAAWVDGRIDKLYVNFTGITVNKGHPLVYIYSPDLISTEKEYLLAVENLRKVEESGLEDAIKGASSLVKSSRQRLLWWGLSERQVDRIAESGDIEDHITIYAPIGGTVIHKNAYEGMYVKEGDVLFRIADLSRVWLYADIYEDEIPFLYQRRPDDYYECPMHPEVEQDVPGKCPKCGMDLLRTNKQIRAEITARAFPAEIFQGSISFTDPFLNPETRTVRVRVNINNPDLRLKPDMYARVRIKLPVGEVLAVPENAVIHSGKRKIVLVEEEKGRFRPQPVKLGRLWLSDMEREDTELKKLSFKRGAIRFHELIAGLKEGEQVVTSGNFLLGSESQLQGALAKMLELTEEESKKVIDTALVEAKEESYAFGEEEKIREILDAYFTIGRLLSKDVLKGIPDMAEKIRRSASSKVIRKAAEPLLHALHMKDIERTRQDFRGLSDVLIAYLEENRSGLPKLPFRFYCPMAKASWLQSGDQTANPYYGSKMLRCGTTTPWDE